MHAPRIQPQDRRLGIGARSVAAAPEKGALAGRLACGVQPGFARLDGEVRRLEPAWLLASSNRPTLSNLAARRRTPVRAHAYTRVHEWQASHMEISLFVFPLDEVRRLDEARDGEGFSRPTSPSNHVFVRLDE